jgi:eukaryotic-like serine/threonine-protein kinase
MTQSIGQYRIVEELGAGGMGIVYRAIDTELQREVALKRLRPEVATSPQLLERFRNEAKLQGRLNHPNITQLYSLVQTEDTFGIVMEFVDGVMVKDLLPMRWEVAVAVVRRALDALAYAHDLGVLHRDIKPENILIDRRGAVKVMDFGIAYAIGSQRMTREKSIVGTLEYMSPERILGRPMDGRSDIYSLGILLFELISGRLPFEVSGEYELLRWHLEQDPPLLSSIAGTPSSLDQVIARAMAKTPDKRYASCAEMADDLPQPVPGWDAQAELENLVNRMRAGATEAFDEKRCFVEVAQQIAADNLEAAERLLRAGLKRHPREISLREYHAVVARARAVVPSLPQGDDAKLMAAWLRIIAAGRAEDEVAQREALKQMEEICPSDLIVQLLAARFKSSIREPRDVERAH